MHLRVIFEPSDEGGHTACVPALPGCVSEAATLDQARTNIREAIALYLEAPKTSSSPPAPQSNKSPSDFLVVRASVVPSARSGPLPFNR